MNLSGAEKGGGLARGVETGTGETETGLETVTGTGGLGQETGQETGDAGGPGAEKLRQYIPPPYKGNSFIVFFFQCLKQPARYFQETSVSMSLTTGHHESFFCNCHLCQAIKLPTAIKSLI